MKPVARYSLSPYNGLIYEAERGMWMRHCDLADQLRQAKVDVLREAADEINGFVGSGAERLRYMADEIERNKT